MESRGRIENVQELRSSIIGFLEGDPDIASLAGFLEGSVFPCQSMGSAGSSSRNREGILLLVRP